MKAIWNNTVIADSEDTVMVEGNHYFPEQSVNKALLQFSNHKTSCAWKGQASYYSLLVNGDMNVDAAWFYPDPKPEAESIRKASRSRLKWQRQVYDRASNLLPPAPKWNTLTV